MGPRRAPIEAERRTKQRQDRASSSRAQEELQYGYLFGGDAAEHARFIEGLARRDVIEPKSLDSAFFIRERFDVVSLLEASHLRIFAEMECRYSEVMVRAFYHNLSYSQGVLTSRVCGVNILMTPAIWTELLGYDFDAHHGLEYDGDSLAPIPGYVREDIIHECRRRDIARGHVGVYTVGSLNVDARVLHYIITHVIFPRAFNHSRVMESDWIILWAIRHRQQLNWRHFICWMMGKAKYKGALPFAYLIQRILEHFHVNMNTEVLKLNSGYNAKFGARLLERTGIHKVRGRWLWKTQPQVEDPIFEDDVQMDEPQPDVQMDEPPLPPLPPLQQMIEPEAGWSLGDVMTGINTIMLNMGHMQQTQSHMQRTQRSISARLGRLERPQRRDRHEPEPEPVNEEVQEESGDESGEESGEETDEE